MPVHETSYPGAAGNPNVFASPLAIQLAEKKPAMLFHSDHTHGISTNLSGQDISGYYSVVSGVGGAPIINIPPGEHGDMLSYIMQIEQNSNVYSQAISTAFNAGNNQANYPTYDLANQLKTVARLVHGGIQTKVFLVSLNGFDTHDAQVDPTIGTSAGRHAELLTTLSQSIAAFFQDIQPWVLKTSSYLVLFLSLTKCKKMVTMEPMVVLRLCSYLEKV